MSGAASFGDVMGTFYSNDTEIEKVEKVENQETQAVIYLKSKKKSATFLTAEVTIDMKTSLISKAVMYGASKQLLKKALYTYGAEYGDEKKTPFLTSAEVEDGLEEGSSATITFSKPKMVDIATDHLVMKNVFGRIGKKKKK